MDMVWPESTVSFVGLRELRQHASDIVRRVEEGEEIVVTVAGRPSARLIPVQRQQWRSHADIAELFRAEPDPDWQRDQELIDHSMRDPWGAE
jgi:prevent-host-death family protein